MGWAWLRTDDKIVATMKRPPRPREPALIHITNSGHRQRVALARENFDAKTINVIEKNFPRIPGLPWTVAKVDGGFTVLDATGNRISENLVWQVRESIELETTLLADAEKLTADELITLSDLEQYVAIVLVSRSLRSR